MWMWDRFSGWLGRQQARLFKSKRKIDTIVVHHSASPKKKTTLEQIRRWHLERGWRDVGYHYFLEWNERNHRYTWRTGRPIDEAGAHCRGSNARSIGVCLAGNYMTENLDADQLRALSYMLALLCQGHGLDPDAAVKFHREMPRASTACPGKDVMDWWGEIIRVTNSFADHMRGEQP